MYKKIIGKAIAGTAAAGLVLVPSAVTVAPQIVNVACQYPDPAATDTSVSLNFAAAPYGSRNRAVVNVTSGAGTPKGRVRIHIESRGTTVQRLQGDSVSRALPRALDAGRTYTVRANFIGACRFRNSADRAFYTVTKAAVNVNPAIRNARQASFSAAFFGSGGLHPQGGRAVFTVKRAGNGKVVRKGADGVRNGFAAVNLKNLRKGNYRLVVRYAGGENFKSGSDSIRFRVGR